MPGRSLTMVGAIAGEAVTSMDSLNEHASKLERSRFPARAAGLIDSMARSPQGKMIRAQRPD